MGNNILFSKINILIYVPLVILLLSYNNCAPSFNASNDLESNTKNKVDPGDLTPPLVNGPPAAGKVTCNASVDQRSLLQGNLGTLTKQQYENSIQTIFNIKMNSTFPTEFIEYSFRTTFNKRPNNLEYTEKIFDNAKTVMDLIEASSENNKKLIYFCAQTDSKCLTNFIIKWGRLLFRRSLTTDEVKKVTEQAIKLSADVKDIDNKWYYNLKTALFTLLASPQFIYQNYGLSANLNSLTQVSELELASKLSFFIWGSSPDETLINLADNNKLRTQLDGQITRLLASSKSNYIARELAQNWLGLGALNINPKEYGSNNFSDTQIKNALIEQLITLIDDLIKNDKPVTDLITTNKMYHNNVTKELYKLRGNNFNSNQLISGLDTLPQNNGIGILAHMGLNSSVTSGHDYSIFHRGPWLLENVICGSVPGLPSGTPLEGAGVNNLSLTESLKLHSKSGTDCAFCHKSTDPLGAALENYDSLGRYRENYVLGNSPISYSYDTKDGANISSAKDLARYISSDRREDYEKCVATQLLTLATSKDFNNQDGQCYAQKVYAAIPGNNLTFKQLIKQIVLSSGFNTTSKGK